MIRHDWGDPNPVFIDFETQSAADLREVGGRLYAEHPSTRVMLAVALIDREYHVWSPLAPLAAGDLNLDLPIVTHHTAQLPSVYLDAARSGKAFVAHNAFGFDRFIWTAVGGPAVPWADTIPMCRAAGYPASLGRVSQQMGSEGKDSGHRILMRCCKAEYHDGRLIYPRTGPGDLAVIARYCAVDVEMLRRVWEELSGVPVEADVLLVHDRINDRGVCVDTELCSKLVQVSLESVARAADRISELTAGALHRGNLRSVQQVNGWLASQGVRIRDYTGKTSLRKDIVAQALASPWLMLDDDVPAVADREIPPAVFEVLRLRSAALRITGGKAERAVIRTGPDGRARDLYSYWQSHTGRWSSAGIQVHNLPRPRKGVPVVQLLERHAAAGEFSYDSIREMLPTNLTVDDALSSLLRPIFAPAPGCAFAIADYAAVECRGTAWIAGEDDLLASLAAGVDIYRQTAGRIFGCAPEAVTDAQRHIGKTTVLGCGYSMAAEKFRLYCGLAGIDLAAAETSAEACVEAFRGAYPRIAGTYAGTINGTPYRRGGIWDQLIGAAMRAVADGGMHYAGRCGFSRDEGCLIVDLPSQRQLRYRNARIEDRIPGYALALGIDKKKATLVYDSPMGTAILYGGKITENIVQAICRDLMASALVTAEDVGLRPVMHTHDEIVCEAPEESIGDVLQRLCGVMATPPSWADGFPIGVEGHGATRYLKSPSAGMPTVKI